MVVVRYSVFSDLASDHTGGAIQSFADESLNVIEHCVFNNISTNSNNITSNRVGGDTSGGAILLDRIKNTNISNCLFYRVTGKGYGQCVSVGGPPTSECRYSCLSDNSCGKSPCSTIFIIDRSRASYLNCNSTHQTAFSSAGVWHAGYAPEIYKFKFNFAESDLSENFAIYGDSPSTSYESNTFSYIILKGFVNENGILNFVTTTINITNCHFLKCQGTLFSQGSKNSIVNLNTVYFTSVHPSYESDAAIKSKTNVFITDNYDLFTIRCKITSDPDKCQTLNQMCESYISRKIQILPIIFLED